LFKGKKVSHVLNFSKPEYEQTVVNTSGRVSLSGVQPKHSLRLNGNVLELTEEDGEYLLKPHPNTIMEYVLDIPANEHFTMQTASQIFRINTSENAIVFFADTFEPCYLTKRFDRLPDGRKINTEDFTQIAGKTEETDGADYKYNFSYEDIAEKLKSICGAYPVEVEKFFKVLVFNYLMNNGDAHMKNFSMIKNDTYNDYLLSPMYDLLNTRIHFPKDAELALELFKDSYLTESFKVNAHYLYEDFYEFGIRIGMKEKRVENVLEDAVSKYGEIENLAGRAFLSDEVRIKYLECVRMSMEKLRR
jgi:serine/threonine-protein kinase HipA